MNKDKMELEKAIEKCNKIITTKFNNDYSIDSEDKQAIETVLQELQNSIPKKKIEDKIKKLRQEALEVHSILLKQTKKEYDYMLYKHYLDVIQQIKILQELLCK